MTARAVWSNVHLYAALIVGILLALMGVSGALLAMKEPLLRWEVGAATLDVAQREAPLSPVGVWLERAQASYPQIEQVFAATAPRASPLPTDAGLLTVMLKGGELAFVTVDPYSGRPLGLFRYRDTFFFRILDLHRSLLLPPTTGSTVVACCGVLLLLSAGTGLYLWWPRGGRWRDGLRLGLRLKGVRFLRQFHGASAAWAFIPLIVLALTGVGIARPDWAKSVIQPFSPVRVTDPMQGHMASMEVPDGNAACEAPTLPDTAVLLALREVPGARFASIAWGGPMPYALRLKSVHDKSGYGDSEVVVDRQCPRVLHVVNIAYASRGDVLATAIHPLHERLLLGSVGNLVVLATGLTLPVLYVTGLTFWLRRNLPRWRRHPTS